MDGFDPFADTGVSIDQLNSLEPRELDELFVRLEHARRAVEAALVQVIEHADRNGTYTVDAHRSVRGWARALGRWSGPEVTHRVRTARLARADARFADALQTSSIGVAQAHRLARAHANPRCGDQLPDVLDILLTHARHLPYDDFARVVDHWERLADIDGAHDGAAATHRRRTASIHIDHGEVHLSAAGDAATGGAMREIFDRFCRAEFLTDWQSSRDHHGDEATAATMPRTDSQRRYDALFTIFERAAATPVDAAAAEPLVNIIVDAHTLDTIVNTTPTTPVPADPRHRRCETTNGDPLTPADALAAMIWGRVRRVVVDTSGVVVDLGRTSRLFTGAARDAVMLQSTHCVVAGCKVPVATCQADHLEESCDHGPTAPKNGAPLCGHHNRLKARRRFTVWRDPCGYWHTYRPDGTEITDHAAPHAA